jgi:hypothetical protein
MPNTTWLLIQYQGEEVMARGKKKVGKKHRSGKTRILPEHMGKTLHKRVGRKRSRRK